MELALQMAQNQVAVAAAGGLDDPDNPIGTDPMKVMAAIESVYSDDGVVVLMDLGSALLSTEMALEFLPPEQQANIHLSAAPLTEGAVAAVVQASVGGSVEAVLAEANSALASKQEHLGQAEAPLAASTPDTQPAATEPELILTIRNPLGLHARPAAQFVSVANRFAAAIVVTKGDKQANAKSINQVATLGVRQGDVIGVQASGDDAAEALAAIEALAAEDFGESVTSAPATTATQTPLPAPELQDGDGAIAGIAASPGIAVGPAALYRPRVPDVERRTISDPEAEWDRLSEAIDAAIEEIDQLYKTAVTQVGREEAAIFEAHRLFLQDPTLLDATRLHLAEQMINAEAAWQHEIEKMAETYRGLDDAYMQARAADIGDVGQRVLRQLMGEAPPSLSFAEPSILIASDLTPSDTAQLNPEQVLGLCTELGGATAHSAILARALGIPAVVGAGRAIWNAGDGALIAIDGSKGRIWLEPDEDQVATLRAERESWQEEQRQAKAAGQEAAVTQDGHTIEVAANVGGPNDVPIALEFGAEGVGLFRTEFLFMDRDSAPTEEEQLVAYRDAAARMGPRPLVIRTLDVGGDKPLPYLDLSEEANPFLGWRGIRFCLDRPDLFRPQLRAILRASVDETGQPYQVKMMFPMVGTVAELTAARALLADVEDELRAEGIPFDEAMEVGIMIEVPSAVVVADQLAPLVDFFSIGTNDLTQYTMAADRGNANVATLVNALQPAVLRMVDQTVRAGHEAGIWVGMCGELAGRPEATPVLVGLGLDELSMSAPAIPAVKDAIRNLTLADAERLTAEVLAAKNASDVANILARSASSAPQ